MRFQVLLLIPTLVFPFSLFQFLPSKSLENRETNRRPFLRLVLLYFLFSIFYFLSQRPEGALRIAFPQQALAD